MDEDEVEVDDPEVDAAVGEQKSGVAARLVPRRPGPCRAKAGDGKATVWWGEDGEDPLESEGVEFAKTEWYVVYKYRLDGEEWKEKGESDRLEVRAPTTSITVERLGTGRQFRFAVRAKSRKGVSSKESMVSNTVVPFEPLPEPWTEHFDAVNGKAYFYNPETKKRTWTRPRAVVYTVSAENEARFQEREISKLRGRFCEVDADESGFIDVDELCEVMAELGQPVTEARAAKLIASVDADGSGQIEFDEFLTMMYKLKRGQLDGKLARLLQGGADVKGAAGALINRVKKGVTGDAARLEQIHQQNMLERARWGKWHEKFDEARRRKFYVHAETKEKRWVLPDEVMWYLPDELRAQFTAQEIEAFEDQFARFDEDASGEMDVDELTEAMRALGEEIEHKKALEMIRKVDVDNSGQLNFAEFVQLLAARRKAKRGINFRDRIVKVAVGSKMVDVKEVDRLRKDLFEVKKENKYLRAKVHSLEQEARHLRCKRFVFIPIIPTAEFLAQHRLTQYAEAMAKFGVRDTTDMFRLEEADYDHELGFKLGHKRKILVALKRLEEKAYNGGGGGGGAAPRRGSEPGSAHSQGS